MMDQEIEIVREVLEGAGLVPEELGDAPGYMLPFKEGRPEVVGIALVYSEEGRFVFYLEFRERCSEARIGDVVDFITRANFGLTIGNFEMDIETGVIRFKSSIDYQGTPLAAAMVRRAILSAMEAVEIYEPGLVRVLAEGVSARTAIEEVEAQLDSDL